jgi:hypothetical protein
MTETKAKYEAGEPVPAAWQNYTPETLRAAFSDPTRYVLPPGSMTLEPEQVVAGKFADAWQAIEDALLALTPGGSEFVGSPQRCLEFIKDRMATVMKVAAKNKALEAELEAAKAREEAEESDTGLRRAEVLARKLYRIVKHPDNAGVGKVSLHYQEPDGSIGVVLVLAPDKGNAAIVEAVEAIYEKQDQAASESPGTVGEEGT